MWYSVTIFTKFLINSFLEASQSFPKGFQSWMSVNNIDIRPFLDVERAAQGWVNLHEEKGEITQHEEQSCPVMRLHRTLTRRRWRWSSVRESCSSSVFLNLSSVISSCSSSVSFSFCFSAAFSICSIISSRLAWHRSMERIIAIKSSVLSALSFSVFCW